MALFWSSESGLRVLIHGFYIETKTDFQPICVSFSNNPGKWARVNSVRPFRSYSGLVSPTIKPGDARACIFPFNPVQLCLLLLKGVSLPEYSTFRVSYLSPWGNLRKNHTCHKRQLTPAQSAAVCVFIIYLFIYLKKIYIVPLSCTLSKFRAGK